MKLCSRLLMGFDRNFCENDKFGYLNPIFGEVRGDARPWLMARWKVHGRFSIRVNWTFFAIYYGSRIMRRNVYSSAVITGGRPLCSQILPGQGPPPSTILGLRNLETLGYLAMKTAFLCFPSFWQNTRVWWTDGRICRSIYSRLQS